MNQELYQQFINNPDIKNNWSAVFLRDAVITDLLGDEVHSILYWAGKRMARQFATANPTDLAIFFEQSGLGNLIIDYQDDNLIEWTLSGPVVENRLAINPDADFMLEAGLLAQSIEQQHGFISEAEINKKQLKKGVVNITVHIDPQNPADEFERMNNFKVISDRINPPANDEENNE